MVSARDCSRASIGYSRCYFAPVQHHTGKATRAEPAPLTRRWHTLAQTYFGDMCFYFDVRAALVLNSGAILDAHVFGDTFDASMDAFKAWDTVRSSTQRG